MTLPFLLGAGLAATAALVVSALRRLPRRTRCPECGRRTDAVLPPPWLKPGQKWLSMRFCAVCSWEGIGRRGPDPVPGRKVAHDSGFHWGADETEPDHGFRWAATPEPAPLRTPPDHPSGFRFGDEPEGSLEQVAHPSGFAWGRQSASVAQGGPTAHRSGFVWSRRPDGTAASEQRPEERPGFRWGDAGRPTRAFRWKGEA